MNVSGPFDSLVHLLRSKRVKGAASMVAPFIPGGTAMLGTLSKLDEIVNDAKEGNPIAVETVRAIKMQSDTGDPVATRAVATMAVISRAQDIKGSKRSFYSRGISVGHDPVTFGQSSRDQRGGRGGGGGVSVTEGRTPAPPGSGGGRWGSGTRARPGSPLYESFAGRARAPVTVGPRPGLRTPVGPAGPRMPPAPPAEQPPVDPYAQQDPYAPQQDPYAQYPGYPGFPGYPQYPQYPIPQFDPYGLQGLPPGYGQYEEPIIDKGGFQQYDPDTDSFFSSRQKQVYDESTGMFMPVQEYNPYGF